MNKKSVSKNSTSFQDFVEKSIHPSNSSYSKESVKKNTRNTTFPINYNFLLEYPYCKIPIFNQSGCSTCYAFAVSASLSHRFCKQTGNFYYLNPQDLIYCDYFSSGCFSGSHEYLSWRYIQYNGLPNISCQSFNLLGTCNFSTKCKRYYTKYKSLKTINGEESIIKEILKNGPVTALIQLKSDFSKYKEGIYESNDIEKLNLFHIVEIIGWGIEKNKSYWLIQNSYGSQWGDNGFFKIIRGKNHLGIEGYATSAEPLI